MVGLESDAAGACLLGGTADAIFRAMTRVAIGGLTGVAIGLGIGLGASVSPIVAACGAVVLGAVIAAIILEQQRRP